MNRKNREGDPLPLSYWAGLLKHDLERFGLGRPFWRAAWRSIIHRDNGERCGDCGRGYILWMGNDHLYRQVIGSGGGLWCPACFSKRADAHDILIMWQPLVWRHGDTWHPDIAKQIGAFQ